VPSLPKDIVKKEGRNIKILSNFDSQYILPNLYSHLHRRQNTIANEYSDTSYAEAFRSKENTKPQWECITDYRILKSMTNVGVKQKQFNLKSLSSLRSFRRLPAKKK
jgi:hypothetical protein